MNATFCKIIVNTNSHHGACHVFVYFNPPEELAFPDVIHSKRRNECILIKNKIVFEPCGSGKFETAFKEESGVVFDAKALVVFAVIIDKASHESQTFFVHIDVKHKDKSMVWMIYRQSCLRLEFEWRNKRMFSIQSIFQLYRRLVEGRRNNTHYTFT
jgi:transposase-like protein